MHVEHKAVWSRVLAHSCLCRDILKHELHSFSAAALTIYAVCTTLEQVSAANNDA